MNGAPCTRTMQIPLTNSDIVALVSEEDYELVSQFNWRIMNTGYISTGYYDSRYDPPKDTFKLLHRFVLGLGKGRIPEVDHRNKIKHDCTRGNLRIATRAENMQNTDNYKDGLPKGVTRLPAGNYRAMVRHERKLIHLGCFDTVAEAYEARQRWEKDNWISN